MNPWVGCYIRFGASWKDRENFIASEEDSDPEVIDSPLENVTNPDNNHNGSNIFVSDFAIVDDIRENLDFAYGNDFLQGLLHDITSVEVRGGYLLNPRQNMRLTAYVRHRILNIPDIGMSHKNTMIGVRFETALFNRYYDF